MVSMVYNVVKRLTETREDVSIFQLLLRKTEVCFLCTKDEENHPGCYQRKDASTGDTMEAHQCPGHG